MAITITTVKQTADVQVLGVNAYLISKIMRAQIILNNLINEVKHERQHYDKEAEKWVKELDDKNNPIIDYSNVKGQPLAEQVLPILTEIVEAFEAES